ncbi:response regulator transcription factor [Paenibacillus radicis (ex Xue et al. 2023)]|uniref:Response regulator transcription factor n=1 Tax=Paenibacillus radicis (ex Xue et al. 2023) TaxID=2972489 RepID=A0ABT1YTJ5_9BACL|nr:response regulator transcription factor [Paenibacillus radicis (ex Xue et al. 2023)]MCR8636020.1 response regulator transcription factor [Paenibacillus radicis (ex Xue et al. 2023)]
MYRIYLVEDEPNLNQVLASYLRNEGWEVEAFVDGGEARKAIRNRPHLWILDIMLPGVDGYQLIREIKADQERLPVIFISARDADIDRVVGLELGSDDYLAKPFLPRELVIRTRKLLERIYTDRHELSVDSSSLHTTRMLPPYRIDEQERRVLDEQENRELELTSKEFDLLVYFAVHAGQLMERGQVLDSVWGDDYYGSDRVVDDLVRRLRKKMPHLRLETVYGYGYRMVLKL